MYGRKPPDGHERERRIAAIMTELARQERRDRIILAVMILASTVVLVVVMGCLSGFAGEPRRH
jgi:ABC-type lipoprotein release transport system permease subunit